VADELMAKQIEVDPFGSAAALETPEHVRVEAPGLGDITNLHGNVKRRQPHVRSPAPRVNRNHAQ
jgi:hypothetical protein